MVLDSTGRSSSGVRRLASCGAFVTDSSVCRADKRMNRNRRAEETGGVCTPREMAVADVAIIMLDRDVGGCLLFFGVFDATRQRQRFSDLGCEMQHT